MLCLFQKIGPQSVHMCGLLDHVTGARLTQKRVEFESENACLVNVWGCAENLPNLKRYCGLRGNISRANVTLGLESGNAPIRKDVAQKSYGSL